MSNNYLNPRIGDNLAAIRLLAAVAVIYGHAFPLTGLSAPGYLVNGVQTIAVKVFFVISGMLITQSWLRDPNLRRYLHRRILRIVPALLVLCLITVFLFGPILTTLPAGEFFRDQSTYMYFWNVLFYPIYRLPGIFEENIYKVAVNGSLWTLPVEMFMYLTIPAVLYFKNNAKAMVILAIIFTSLVSLLALHGPFAQKPFVIYGTNIWSAFDLMPYFFIGAAVSIFKLQRFANLQVAFILLLVAPIASSNTVAAEAILLVILPFIVLSFAYDSPPVFAFLDKIGDISYGVYLYGFLFQQMASYYFELARTPFWNFLIALAPTLIFASLSWAFVEKPSLSLKPRSADRTNPIRNRPPHL